MMMKLRDRITLDEVASMLASDAGQVWEKMSSFPGYNRRVWRDEARARIRKADPEARIECQPASWDGREGMCFIRRPGED
jgi:hypothetical protein